MKLPVWLSTYRVLRKTRAALHPRSCTCELCNPPAPSVRLWSSSSPVMSLRQEATTVKGFDGAGVCVLTVKFPDDASAAAFAMMLSSFVHLDDVATEAI